MKNYKDLDFSREELTNLMKEYYSDIIDFITQPTFQRLFYEMMCLKPTDRPTFVSEVWLNKEYLIEKGIVFKDGILIQTSAFGDRRPTLFVVKKFLPKKYHRAWENVNWTFNNDFKNEDVPYDPKNSWRLPLNVSVQNAIISKGLDIQDNKFDTEVYSQELYDGQIQTSEKR